jgi:hypothetical protein
MTHLHEIIDWPEPRSPVKVPWNGEFVLRERPFWPAIHSAWWIFACLDLEWELSQRFTFLCHVMKVVATPPKTTMKSTV